MGRVVQTRRAGNGGRSGSVRLRGKWWALRVSERGSSMVVSDRDRKNGVKYV